VLQSFSDALVAVVRRASRSVVQVSSGRGVGTGVIWDKSGNIATNSHVVARGYKLEVTLPSGETMAAKVIGHDRLSDIALVSIEGYKGTLAPIERGDSENLSVGQFVVALANPFGEIVSACSGVITNPKGKIGGPWTDKMVITDVRLNRGYSGGPLVDASGRMIGMNAAVFSNRGIAIPINVLATTVSELLSSGTVKRAYLGIVSNPIMLPDEVAAEVGQSEGLIVLSVEQGSPAKKGAVAVGDIIVGLNSNSIETYHDLQKILTSGVIGKEIELIVLRGEKEIKLKITPVEA
jgi:serine protease Do